MNVRREFYRLYETISHKIFNNVSQLVFRKKLNIVGTYRRRINDCQYILGILIRL